MEREAMERDPMEDHITEARAPEGDAVPRRAAGRGRPGERGWAARMPALALLLLSLGLAGCSGEAAREGTAEAPEWLPRYPGAEETSVFETPTEEGSKGTVALTTADGASEVMSFYKKELEADGFDLEIIPYPTDHGRGASLQGHSASETEGLFLIVSPREDGGSSVFINYEQAR